MVKIDILKWCDTYIDLKKIPEYYQNAEETKGYLETLFLSLLIASFTSLIQMAYSALKYFMHRNSANTFSHQFQNITIFIMVKFILF